MKLNKRFILIGILIISTIASLSAVRAAKLSFYLPLIVKMQHVAGTPDPCAPNPYPIPTPIECPTATPTFDPYLPPATQTPWITTATLEATQTPWIITATPEATQTPWVITATPAKFDKYIYLPVIN